MADNDDDDLADSGECNACVPMNAFVCLCFGLRQQQVQCMRAYECFCVFMFGTLRQGDNGPCTARQECTIGADNAITECSP